MDTWPPPRIRIYGQWLMWTYARRFGIKWEQGPKHDWNVINRSDMDGISCLGLASLSLLLHLNYDLHNVRWNVSENDNFSEKRRRKKRGVGWRQRIRNSIWTRAEKSGSFLFFFVFVSFRTGFFFKRGNPLISIMDEAWERIEKEEKKKRENNRSTLIILSKSPVPKSVSVFWSHRRIQRRKNAGKEKERRTDTHGDGRWEVGSHWSLFWVEKDGGWSFWRKNPSCTIGKTAPVMSTKTTERRNDSFFFLPLFFAVKSQHTYILVCYFPSFF